MALLLFSIFYFPSFLEIGAIVIMMITKTVMYVTFYFCVNNKTLFYLKANE